MTLSTRIAPHLPYLRRYSRALTGSQTSGDAYVAAVLEALIADRLHFPGGEQRSGRAVSTLYKAVRLLVGLDPRAGLALCLGAARLDQSRNRLAAGRARLSCWSPSKVSGTSEGGRNSRHDRRAA